MNNKWKFGWRLAVIAVLGIVLYSFLSYTIREVKDHLDWESYGQSIEDYDYYLYAGNYSQMRWRLNNANPRGEEFQLYWDVADAYASYELCRFWRLAAEAGGADGNAAGAANGNAADDQGSAQPLLVTAEDCVRYAEKYKEQLLHIYENSGEQARRHIRSFAKELLP